MSRVLTTQLTAEDETSQTCPPARWAGVEVTESGRVSSLSLKFNDLEGPLIPQVTCFQKLCSLQLRGNHLDGPIPHNLFRSLIFLEIVDLSENDFQGRLPEMGESLRELNVSSNRLTGPLPGSIGESTGIVALHLSDNRLSGPLPDSLSNLTCLRTLDIHVGWEGRVAWTRPEFR